MSQGRKAVVGTAYGGSDITEYISDYVESFSYTDVASGESDSISFSLRRETPWLPRKGDRMAHVCLFTDWEAEGDSWLLNCGNFQVDDITISGDGTASLGGTSIPMDEAFNAEERDKTWENVTVREIGTEIAARAGVEFYYEAENIKIKSMEQDKQTDCKFLYAVCQQYGLAMKVFSNRIIIFDEAVYEARESVMTLYEHDFNGTWKYNTTLSGTYTGAKISYSDPATGKDHTVSVGTGPRILNINKQADSVEDARKKALAELNNNNKKASTFTGPLFPKKGIVAGVCVDLAGFGMLDGKYYIDKAVTKVTGKGASQTVITMHIVGGRATGGTAELDPENKKTEDGAYTQYTVIKGDTLWTIAEKLLGNPLKYQKIYEINQEVIETEALAHGKPDSGSGHWLFPGIELNIPPAEEEEVSI